MLGSNQDIELAKTLYKENREYEALKVLDKAIGIEGLEVKDQFRTLKENFDGLRIKPPYEMTEIEEGILLEQREKDAEAINEWGQYALYDILILRSKCLSAIVWGKKQNEEKEAVLQDVLSNVYLVKKLFSDVSKSIVQDLWSLSAQSLFFIPGVASDALYMLFLILEENPGHEITHHFIIVSSGVLEEIHSEEFENDINTREVYYMLKDMATDLLEKELQSEVVDKDKSTSKYKKQSTQIEISKPSGSIVNALIAVSAITIMLLFIFDRF